MTDRTDLSGGWRDNVLHGVTRRTRPPGQEISRRIPMFRERRIRAIEGVDDL